MNILLDLDGTHRLTAVRAALALALALVACRALADGAAARLLQATLPGTSKVVVVAEGELEPRSTGSYSIRVYGGSNARHPHDDFLAGAVERRYGALERIVFADVDGDRAPEIVVVMRSAGSGSYVSADAFRLRGRSLTRVRSVQGLAKNADPLRALQESTVKR